MGAVAAGQVADLADAFVAALGDDVGGAELTTEVGARGMPSHEDDPLGSEPPGRQYGHKADGSVADDGDGRLGADVRPDGAW